MQTRMQPTSVIEAKLGLEVNGRVQRFFQTTCYKAMDRYVPRSAGSDGGSLRETVDLSDPECIVYEMPYARYQYYGMRQDGSHVVKNYTTPGTGPYWDKKMWNARKDDILEQLKNEIMRGG